jgi:hypothetical protein
MRKALAIIILVLVAFVGVSSAKATVLKVKVQTANVRSEPDTSASVVAQLKVGTLIEARSKVDSWYEISVTGKNGEEIVGYIHASVVEIVGGETPAPQEPRPARTEPAREVSKPAPSYARAAAPSGAKKFKIMAGLAMANQRLDSDSQKAIDDSGLTKGNLMGIGAGVGYEFSLSQNLFLELDGFFVPGGVKVSGKYLGTDIVAKTHGSAVGAGLLGKFKFMPEGSTPYAMVGADVGYVLSMKAKTDSGSEKGTDEDILKNINRMYYGIDLGIGYELEMSGMTFVIEGRYLMGLSNMLKKPAEVADKDWKSYAKPTTMGFMVGIKL